MVSVLKREATEELQEFISNSKRVCDHEKLTDNADRSCVLSKTCLVWEDFDKPALDLAKYLLGKTLVRIVDGQILSGNIVETEAYPGPSDVASHSFRGKTERNKAMFMAPGTCYVYYIYGRQNCINISSQEYGGAVLFRAIEPVDGTEFMISNRGKSIEEIPESPKKKLHFLKNLTNGPSKMCQAMQITKDEFNCTHFAPNASLSSENDFTKIDDGKVVPKLFISNLESEEYMPEENIETAARIGIDGAGKEAAAQLYRFYIKGNPFVSQLKKSTASNEVV